MADVEKTCANCGHTQPTGDFCENCGTRMPMAPAAETAAPAGEPVAQPGAPAAAGVAGVAATGAGPVTASAPAGPPPTPAPPPYAAQAQYGAAPPSPPPAAGRSFWNRLFDFSFEEFITPTIMKVLYIIAMVVIGLSVLGMIVAGFTSYGGMGVFWLIGALIWGFISLLVARVLLEMIVVFFRIRDNTEEIATKKR